MRIEKYKITKLENGKNLFFISDTHFNHANIINLANRPFKDVLEMNKILIENWNKTVSKHDTVFMLGDFCFGQASVWQNILSQLNGEKILILGNHDYKRFHGSLERFFTAVVDRLEIKIGDQKIVLDHYPGVIWSGAFKGSWQLYGHIHEKDFERAKPTQYNVGVERNNYSPISFEDVEAIIKYQIENNMINLTKEKWDTIQISQ